MGTNYYFKIKDIYFKNDIRDKYLKEWNIVHYKPLLHIGKRSAGWKPLFECHNELFTSVKEIKKYYDNNKEFLDIINEYNEYLTWEQLEEELINWNRDNINSISHIFMVENNYEATEKVFNSKNFQNNLLKYNKKYPHGKRNAKCKYEYINYITDDEGYEFTWGNFS